MIILKKNLQQKIKTANLYIIYTIYIIYTTYIIYTI